MGVAEHLQCAVSMRAPEHTNSVSGEQFPMMEEFTIGVHEDGSLRGLLA